MAPSPMEWYSGNPVFQISVGTCNHSSDLKKNEDVNVHNIKVHLFHFFGLLEISKNIIAPH